MNAADLNSFVVLDNASSNLDKKIQGGLYINYIKPSLNKEFKHYHISLLN